MMKMAFPALALLALTACSPEVPDSGAGVGFDRYDSYQTRRDARLSGEATVRLPQDSGAAEDSGATRVASAAPDQQLPDVTTNNPGLSDEQNFQAVTARETIESDKQRLEAQREEYKFIPPKPLPGRTGDVGPNIVQYALTTSNRVGEQVYRRSSLLRESRSARSCARYSSPDKAQEAFLKAGGPERDRYDLDPDGDGFACGWDPRPFRMAVNR